jgi:hypothetical protein
VESFDVKKAADILARMLDEKNRELGRAFSSVFGFWSEVVGLSLAEHSRIYEIANQNLFVEVDHPGWMQLLFLKKPQILRALRRKFPDLRIKDLRVKVNLRYSEPIPAEEPQFEQNGDEAEAKGERREDIERILSSVSQEELKQRLKRLFVKSLEKGDSG